MTKSLAVGSISGAGSGLALGTVLAKDKSKRSKKQKLGAIVGAGVGAIGSYFLHKKMLSKEEKIRRNTLFNLEKFGVESIPKLRGMPKSITKPIIKEKWIDTKVQGEKLIEGHRVWIIEENSKWNMR